MFAKLNWWYVSAVAFLLAALVMGFDYSGGVSSALYPISRTFGTAAIVLSIIGLGTTIVDSNERYRRK